VADFTSTQTGNWNDGGTWGNTSPGSAGVDYPGANSDTATIGHTVTYDVGASAITWGNVTINASGILTFPTASNSTLLFSATGVLTVNNGGELRAGTSGTPIGSGNTCKLHWTQGSSARNVFVLNDGGILSIYGDPAYYGSQKYAYLDSDWTAGQSFYVTGDRTGWVAGRKFYIHENITYDSFQNDGHVYTVASVSVYDDVNDRTQITISEAEPAITFNATNAGHSSKLIMLSRNVELADPAATWGIYDYNSYSEYLQFDNNQASGNSNINVQDAVIYGWDKAIDGGYNYNGTNLIFVSNNYGINYGINHQVTGDFVSNNYGINSGTNHQVTGDFVSNNYGINSGANHQVTGDFVSNYYGIYYGANHQVTGDFVSNNYGIRYGTNYQVTGDFVSNNYGINDGATHQVTGDFVSNNYGIRYGTNHQVTGDFVSNNYGINDGTNHQVTGDFNANTTDVSLSSGSGKRANILEDCLLDGTDRRAIRIYGNSGNILPLISGDAGWQTPDSGNSWIMQMSPNSYCDTSWSMQMELAPINKMADYCTSGSKTLTVKIYPYGWTTALDQDDIVLEVKYLNSASGITRTTVTNTVNTYENGAWRSLTATFNPSQNGILYFNVYLRKYESGCYVLIDPEWSIA